MKAEFIDPKEGAKVKVDPPVSSGKTENIKPNANTAAIPAFEEPAPPRGKQLEGSDPDRTGAGAKDPAPKRESVDGF